MRIPSRLLLLLFLAIICSNNLSAQRSSYTPDTSLTYQVFLQQCKSFKLNSEPQVWVLFFWAGWSSKCVQEADSMIKLYNTFKHKPTRFVSISSDHSREIWEDGLQKTQMPWEHLWIPNDEHMDYLESRLSQVLDECFQQLLLSIWKARLDG